MSGVGTQGDVRDIESRADIERLVRAFYGRAFDDPLIGWLFVDVAKLDLEAHLPVITDFWETILLGARSYSGGAFRPHAVLHEKAGLRGAHFERWLVLWHTTIDERFSGPTAELGKSHAVRVAHAFHARLHGLPAPEGAASVETGLMVTRHGSPPPAGHEE